MKLKPTDVIVIFIMMVMVAGMISKVEGGGPWMESDWEEVLKTTVTAEPTRWPTVTPTQTEPAPTNGAESPSGGNAGQIVPEPVKDQNSGYPSPSESYPAPQPTPTFEPLPQRPTQSP